MTRGMLPKAYLRVDPNIDQTHPDNLDGFIRLLCAANRQPTRGQFRSRAVLDSLFGKTATDRLIKRKDVREGAGGTIVVPGWEGWQEGDHTVAERMRRLRDERNNGVTSASPDDPSSVTAPSLDSNSPSEATRRLGNKASSSSAEEGPADKPRPPSPAQKVKGWLRDHDIAQPTGWEISKVNELAKRFGPDAVIAAFEEARSLNAAVTCKNYVRWAEQSLAPDQSPRTVAAPAGHHGNPKEIADAFQR